MRLKGFPPQDRPHHSAAKPFSASDTNFLTPLTLLDTLQAVDLSQLMDGLSKLVSRRYLLPFEFGVFSPGPILDSTRCALPSTRIRFAVWCGENHSRLRAWNGGFAGVIPRFAASGAHGRNARDRSGLQPGRKVPGASA